jgi:hypothetical protein
MKGNSSKTQNKLAKPVANFLEQSVANEIPANTFIVIDTHSDTYTGNLQHSGGQTHGGSAPLGDVLESFLGKDCMDSMARAKRKRAELLTRSTESHANLNVVNPGGKTFVFLLTCGPAVRVGYHLEHCQGLLKSYVKTF